MLDLVSTHVLPAALRVLVDPKYDTVEARALVLAIGLQESKFRERSQMEGGPARGFWQFERGGGVKGVLMHQATSARAIEALATLRYHKPGEQMPDTIQRVHGLLEHNDVLAAVFARLLLWTVPGKLAGRHEPAIGWSQYLSGWNPGKPHHDTWGAYFATAWAHASRET